MENTERSHDNVKREECVSEAHYVNAVDFMLEFDELLDEYPFLFNIEHYNDMIPLSTSERYEVFKKSAVYYYFLYNLQEYKDLTLRSEIKSVITGLHQECYLMLNNPMLEASHSGYSLLYLNATRFIYELVVKENADLAKRYSNEQIATYLYLLHKTEYFKIFPIPDEAFDLSSSPSPYSVIGEVYARYFLFAKFISEIYQNMGEENLQSELALPIFPNEYIQEVIQENQETRVVKDLMNPEIQIKFDKIINVLSETNPLGAIVTRSKTPANQILLSSKNKLKYSQRQFVYRVEGSLVFIDPKYAKRGKLLTYLFAYMISMKWMTLGGSYGTTAQIIANTFYNKDDETKKITIDRAKLNEYVLELEKNGPIDKENIYLVFINLICGNL